MSDADVLPPRRLLGAPRRLRVLAMLFGFCVLAILTLGSTGTVGRLRLLSGLHLVPALLALALAVLLAPPSGERPSRREWTQCLGAAAGVGTLCTLVAAFSYDRPRWLEPDVFYPQWLQAIGVLSLPSLFVSLALYSLVPLPLLLARWHTRELEWQCGGAALSGLLAVLALSGADMLDGNPGLLTGVAAFAILGAGSYLADRWLDRGRAPTPRAIPLATLPLAFVVCCLLGFGVQGGALLAIEGVGDPDPDAKIEEALLACQDSLRTYHAEHGRYPACLGELPGVDPDLAAGLKGRYLVRYGRGESLWSLAADPLPKIGERRAFYLLSTGEELQRGKTPFGLSRR